MAERFKALVLKTSDAEKHRGFESLSLRQLYMEKYPRGRRGSPAKGVGCDKCRPGSNPGFSAKNLSGLMCPDRFFMRRSFCARRAFEMGVKQISSPGQSGPIFPVPGPVSYQSTKTIQRPAKGQTLTRKRQKSNFPHAPGHT